MQAVKSFNPKFYKAVFFGRKLHVDQNEKLVMYGVTHAEARDRYSRMILGYTKMAIKNNLMIYKKCSGKFILSVSVWGAEDRYD